MSPSKERQIQGLFNLVADANDKLQQAVQYDEKNPDVLREEDSKRLFDVSGDVYTLFEEMTHALNEVDPFDFHEREKLLRERGVVAMKKNILQKLINLANRLDEKGFRKEADEVTKMMENVGRMSKGLGGKEIVLRVYVPNSVSEAIEQKIQSIVSDTQKELKQYDVGTFIEPEMPQDPTRGREQILDVMPKM